MNEQQRIAFLQSQTAAAMIKAMGMQAENKKRELRGESICYSDFNFDALIEIYGLGNNQAQSLLMGY